MQLAFRADSHRYRIYSGENSLQALPDDLDRLGIKRAVIICGQTVSRATQLINHLCKLMGERCAAVFDEAGRHADEEVVNRAAQIVRQCGGDGLVAVGAGSVIMTTRLVAIVLAEQRPVDELVTQYEGDMVHSPRLLAPKLPIVNVLTAPTNAQNRGGSAMRRTAVGRRLEMFDPKTRPASIYWDTSALMTAPPALAFSNGLTTFWWSFMTLGGAPGSNPLVQADRLQSFRLAREALPRMPLDDSRARIEMCSAAFLQNREEEHGGALFDLHWVFKTCYALGSGIFTINDAVDPGQVYACLTGPTIVQFGGRNLPELRFMCSELSGKESGALAKAEPEELALMVSEFFARHGCRLRLRDLGISRDALVQVRDFALRNFNADRRRELRHEVPQLDAVLEASW